MNNQNAKRSKRRNSFFSISSIRVKQQTQSPFICWQTNCPALTAEIIKADEPTGIGAADNGQQAFIVNGTNLQRLPAEPEKLSVLLAQTDQPAIEVKNPLMLPMKAQLSIQFADKKVVSSCGSGGVP